MSSVSPACWAPHTALYFDPSGLVTACCANSSFVLGRIHQGATSDSLESIWRGLRINRLRDALDAGDYALGCQECAAGVRSGAPSLILARHFDQFASDAGDDWPEYMDFALSNTCNLQCAMCNGDLSSSIRSRREGRPPLPNAYGDRFFGELAGFLPHLREASFKGGEPFLSSESRRVWDMILDLEHRPRVTVTTNGTVWNDRVEHYVRELQMSVSISVDGTTAETVEAIRAGADFAQLRANVERFRSVTEGSGGSLVLNYCVMAQNWQEFGAFLLDAERLGLDVHAIAVTAPDAHDILKLPDSDRRRIVAALELEGTALEPALGRNADVWRTQVDRLRRSLDDSAVPHRPIGDGAQVDMESLRSRIRPRADSDLLEVELNRGMVCAVTTPSWAEAMFDTTTWIGVGVHDLPARLADDLGTGYPEILTDEGENHSLDATLRFPGKGCTTVINAVSVESTGGRLGRLLLSEPTVDED